MKSQAILFLSCLLAISCASARAVDIKEFERKLTADGVEVEVHGASAELGAYMLTYRNPKDFFDYLEMSLTAGKEEIAKKLRELGRHDRIRIKGALSHNSSPQTHVSVTELELVKKFDPQVKIPGYQYEARIPDELLNLSEAVFLVHAVHADGQVLVVEYKDATLPVYVKDGALTKNLHRNDVVKLKVVVRSYPDRPVHLSLDSSAPQPVEVMDSVLAMHGKPADVEGSLVLFPKSPQVIFNVFAVLVKLPHGLKRQYTLANFESPAEFKKIREKLQQGWDRHPTAFENGRNKLVSTRVRVRAKGIFNQVDPNQANVQILLSSADDLEILE